MSDGALTRLARFRADAYRLLSQVFLYPEPDRIVSIREAASSLHGRRGLLTTLAIGHRSRKVLRILQAAPADGTTGLQTEFTRLFGLDGAGGCVPYESSWAIRGPEQAAALIAALEQEYAAEGIAVDPTAGEPPDHVAVELEFMAVLCEREAAAWAVSLNESTRTLGRQRLFLRQHLGRWFPRLAQAVTRAGAGSIYAAAADAAAGFIHHDRDLVDLLLSRLNEGAGSVEEPARAGR